MIRILDVFCGCGGASLGFKHALEGYTPKQVGSIEFLKAKVPPKPEGKRRKHEIVGLDIARDALWTYQFNHVGQAIRCDARHNPLREKLNYFDFIIACPPCPAFSSSSTKKTEKHKIEEKLVLTAAEYIATYLPKAFFFENVPGILLRADLMKRFFAILGCDFDEPEWERIRKDALNPRHKAIMGYESRATRPMKGIYIVSWGVLDCVNYGVPQTRKRLIMLGALDIPKYEIIGEWGAWDDPNSDVELWVNGVRSSLYDGSLKELGLG